MRLFLLFSILALTACDSRALPRTDGGPPPRDSGIVIMLDGGTRTDSGNDVGPDASGRMGPPGSACTCDSNCIGEPFNAAVCVGGVC
ncbi:MAG: hypothetical protein K8H88_16850, partial [Sandaracinaceae bacterium]|nr:hypothetical protein [Sandaracinaceae bacterium]